MKISLAQLAGVPFSRLPRLLQDRLLLQGLPAAGWKCPLFTLTSFQIFPAMIQEV